MIKKSLVVFIFSLLAAFSAAAQESIGNYQIRVAPDRDDWTYEPGQTAKFDVSVTLNNRQVSGLPL